MRKIDTSEQTDQRAIFLLAEHFGIVSESQIAEARESAAEGETACEVLCRLNFIDASDWMYLRKRVSDILEDLDDQRPSLQPRSVQSAVDHQDSMHEDLTENQVSGPTSNAFSPRNFRRPGVEEPQTIRRPPPATGEAFLDVEFFDDDVHPPTADEDTAVPEAAPSLLERCVDGVINLVWPILERYPAPITILVVIAIFTLAWYVL